MKPVLAALLLAVPFAVLAQDEMPAVGTQPVVPPRTETKSPGVGTNIIGERESPIGLYITPWRNSSAEKDIDRPARLLQEQMVPVDEDVFARQVDYHKALAGALKARGQVTP